MTKPFSIQSPETLAKEYGGNKQKLAEAMQMGVVDPTAGVLAGMFIDRMRAAQVLEATPQATVAQQVMGGAPNVPPPPPSGGLGAMPQAAPPMAPPMAPPQAPPMDMAPPPPGAPPVGMADGGLASLDIPETMFDEPSNGGFDDGYAGGGMVAFAPGGGVSFEEDFDATFGTGPKPPAAPSYYGYSLDPRQNMLLAQQMAGTPESKYSGMLEKDLLDTLDPAATEKRRKGRMWETLADVGFRLASSRNPSFLGAVGEAGMGALPAAQEAKRLDKAEQKYARKALADLEAGRNTQRAQLAAQAMQMQGIAIQAHEAETGRNFSASQKQLDRDLEWRIATLKENGAMGRAAMRSSGSGGSSGAPKFSPTQAAKAMDNSRRNAEKAYERAKTAEKAGDVAEVERALQEYGRNRAAYNQFAKLRGEAELPQEDLSGRAFQKLNEYATKHGRLPGGRPSANRPAGAKVNKSTAVQNGRIVSVSDIPPAR